MGRTRTITSISINEDDGQLQFPPDDSDGQLSLGCRKWLRCTVMNLTGTAKGIRAFN